MNVNVGQSEVIANETIDIPQKIKINEKLDEKKLLYINF